MNFSHAACHPDVTDSKVQFCRCNMITKFNFADAPCLHTQLLFIWSTELCETIGRGLLTMHISPTNCYVLSIRFRLCSCFTGALHWKLPNVSAVQRQFTHSDEQFGWEIQIPGRPKYLAANARLKVSHFVGPSTTPERLGLDSWARTPHCRGTAGTTH